ncbi:MAG: DNA-3-methyladenine glycosylase I [Actinomycetota bacterium]
MSGPRRCFGDGNPLYERYHDLEWGRRVRDERGIYERICLEAFQSGLSWLIVLRKRDSMRAAFSGFDPEAVASLSHRDIARLLANPGIIRNRAKIEAAIAGARATIEMRSSGQSLPQLVWSFAPRRRRAPRRDADLPSRTNESVALAKALRVRGFRFVGPTTVYATMQAIGVVNDHLYACHVRKEVEGERMESLGAPRG